MRRILEMEMWNNDNQIYIFTVVGPLAFQGVQTKLRDTVIKKKIYKLKREFHFSLVNRNPSRGHQVSGRKRAL